MVMASSTGSTAPEFYRARAADTDARLCSGERTSSERCGASRRRGRHSSQTSALGVEVHPLADQRRAVAVVAARARVGRQRRRSCGAARARSGRAARRRKAWFRESSPWGNKAPSGRQASGRDPIDRLPIMPTGGRVARTARARVRGETDGSTHAQRSRGDRDPARSAARLGAAHRGRRRPPRSRTPGVGRRGPRGPDRARQVPGLRGRRRRAWRPSRASGRASGARCRPTCASTTRPCRAAMRWSCTRRTAYGARRPLAQRRLRQRRARRLGAAHRRRRDRDRPPHPALLRHRHRRLGSSPAPAAVGE